jgi:hypothetical protein
MNDGPNPLVSDAQSLSYYFNRGIVVQEQLTLVTFPRRFTFKMYNITLSKLSDFPVLHIS